MTCPAAISAGQRRRAVRVNQALPPLLAGVKRCTACGQAKRWRWDDRSSEYTVRAHRRLSGFTSYAPEGKCKTCKAAEVKARRERDPEAARAKRRVWYRDTLRADPKRVAALREYWREHSAAERRAQGVPQRRFKDREQDVPQHRVEVAPFLSWMDEWMTVTGTSEGALLRRAFPGEAANAGRTLRRWRDGSQERGQLWILDNLATAMGHPDQLAVLYYDEIEERMAA